MLLLSEFVEELEALPGVVVRLALLVHARTWLDDVADAMKDTLEELGAESVEDLRRQVREVCEGPRLIRNAVNLDRCSLFSPVEARFQCSRVARSLAEERPQMRLDVIR